MAAKMKAEQSAEIEQLLGMREELTGCRTVRPFPDPHMERDMEKMKSMSGAELDLMFVEDMIPHHAGALAFTHNALPQLKHPELDALAHRIIDMQSMEIGHLHMIKMRFEQQRGGAGVWMGSPAPCTSNADCGNGKCLAHDGGMFCDAPEMVVHP